LVHGRVAPPLQREGHSSLDFCYRSAPMGATPTASHMAPARHTHGPNFLSPQSTPIGDGTAGACCVSTLASAWRPLENKG